MATKNISVATAPVKKTKEERVTLPTHEYFDNKRIEFAKGKYNSVFDENKRYIRSQYNMTVEAEAKKVYDFFLKDIIFQLGIKIKESELRPDQILKTSNKNGGVPIRILEFRNGKDSNGKVDPKINYEIEFEFFTTDQWTIRSFEIKNIKPGISKITLKEVLKNNKTIFGFKGGYMKRNYTRNRKLILEYQAFKLKKDLNLFDEKMLPKIDAYERNLQAKIKKNSMMRISH